MTGDEFLLLISLNTLHEYKIFKSNYPAWQKKIQNAWNQASAEKWINEARLATTMFNLNWITQHGGVFWGYKAKKRFKLIPWLVRLLVRLCSWKKLLLKYLHEELIIAFTWKFIFFLYAMTSFADGMSESYPFRMKINLHYYIGIIRCYVLLGVPFIFKQLYRCYSSSQLHCIIQDYKCMAYWYCFALYNINSLCREWHRTQCSCWKATQSKSKLNF